MAVDFRLIIFRPFKGEIITGQIVGATDGGIKGIIALPLYSWSTDEVFQYLSGFLTIFGCQNTSYTRTASCV